MPLADHPAQHAPAQHAPVNHRARARWERLERGVFRAVNRSRREHGRSRLRLAPRISYAAEMHSHDLVAHRFLSHSSSDGTPFQARIRRVTRARVVGETLIAVRGRTTGRRIVRAWLRSPTHRAQVLGRRYRRVGVGRVTRDGTSIVTADFATAR